MKAAVLFVCLGNICRSPLAEAAFRREAASLGLDVEIDSAGTGDWHIGHPHDNRAQAVARAQGIDLDRKSVESGKSVSVRVDLGGSRVIKNKHKQNALR